MSNNRPYLNYDSLSNYIRSGRRGVTSRPLYFGSLSARLVEPNNDKSDITVNYRYRHLVLDEKALSRSVWGREYLKDPERLKAEQTAWGESMAPIPRTYRHPLVTFKEDNVIILHHLRRNDRSSAKRFAELSGVDAIGRYKGQMKVRQYGDKIRDPKVQRKCKTCKGERYYVYTCWNGLGPNDDDMETLSGSFGVTYPYQYCNEPVGQHTSHIVKAPCAYCLGTGGSPATVARWDSFVWDQEQDLAIDLNTRRIIGLVK